MKISSKKLPVQQDLSRPSINAILAKLKPEMEYLVSITSSSQQDVLWVLTYMIFGALIASDYEKGEFRMQHAALSNFGFLIRVHYTLNNLEHFSEIVL